MGDGKIFVLVIILLSVCLSQCSKEERRKETALEYRYFHDEFCHDKTDRQCREMFLNSQSDLPDTPEPYY